jgi:hypothetical protein
MKRYALFFVATSVFLLVFAGRSHAQTPQEIFKSIETAIKGNDLVALSQYFNSNVEITLLDYEKVCSKNQAQMVIKDFFARNPLTKFNMIHVGGAGTAWYGMGTYETASRQFDTNVFIKKYGSVYLIDRIRFEDRPEDSK